MPLKANSFIFCIFYALSKYHYIFYTLTYIINENMHHYFLANQIILKMYRKILRMYRYSVIEAKIAASIGKEAKDPPITIFVIITK